MIKNDAGDSFDSVHEFSVSSLKLVRSACDKAMFIYSSGYFREALLSFSIIRQECISLLDSVEPCFRIQLLTGSALSAYYMDKCRTFLALNGGYDAVD
ncbi:hypothetical protein AH865_15150 [Salmonella enterica subsp. enterica serovar Infantis]|nr:hypothetical protein [Salmonella enterica subsp. enterica serovar Infantis]EGI5076500.1 hypothetical protein [Salmonella enterica subsp. enterica serovar Infantis]